jgi:hypothetical protein
MAEDSEDVGISHFTSISATWVRERGVDGGKNHRFAGKPERNVTPESLRRDLLKKFSGRGEAICAVPGLPVRIRVK